MEINRYTNYNNYFLKEKSDKILLVFVTHHQAAKDQACNRNSENKKSTTANKIDLSISFTQSKNFEFFFEFII